MSLSFQFWKCSLFFSIWSLWSSHIGDWPKHISSRVCCLQTGFTAVVLQQMVTEHNGYHSAFFWYDCYGYHSAFIFIWLCRLVRTWVIVFLFVGHQSTVLVNDARQLISCTDHVSLYHMHTHVHATSSTKSSEKMTNTDVMLLHYWCSLNLCSHIWLTIDNWTCCFHLHKRKR